MFLRHLNPPALWTTLALVATAGHAQLDLSAFYTQTVKTGQPWAQIDTRIDTVDIKVEVNRGVATTQVTFAYTPSKGVVQAWQCLQTPCARPDTAVNPDGKETCPTACVYQAVDLSTLALDSLETTTHFQLADNTVVTDMTLWVGAVPVKAALQDRALASAQYESIVQRRRDPALLETWGNGNYNLRIFPNESEVTRKLHVEFVQGLEQEGSDLSAILPVLQRLTKVTRLYTTQADYEKLPNRVAGLVRVEVVAVDGQSYQLDWPGLGKGQVSATPLKLEAKNIAEIGQGRLSTPANCVSCLKPWTAEVTRFGTRNGYFGVKSTLIAKQLKFAEEPNERHVILDVRNDARDPQAADRARKIALLALKTYAVAPYTANLGFADAGDIKYAFSQPRSMGATELSEAYQALLSWKPGTTANSETTLRAFAQARGQGEKPCALVYIGNDTAAYFNWGTVWNEAAQKQYEQFERAQAAKDSALAAVLKAAQVNLFGFFNNYRLSQVANLTGGYQMGSLYAYGFYYVRPATSAGTTAPIDYLQMPPLYGPGRSDAYAVADLQVRIGSNQVSELVVLQENPFRYYGIVRGGVVMDAMALAKKASGSALAKSSSSLPYYPYGINRDTLVLRISGQYQGSGRVTGEITGIWGGLTFKQTFEIDLPASAGAGNKGAGIWAYQKSEVLGRDYLTDNIKAIQTLGKDYHIVNRQMSLLALEPGMELWTELPSANGANGASGAAERSSTTTADMAMPAGSGAIDQVSLDAILSDFVPILQGNGVRQARAGALVAKRSGSLLEISWLADTGIESADIEIYDLRGMRVAKALARRDGKALVTSLVAPAGNAPLLVKARAGKHLRTVWLGAR